MNHAGYFDQSIGNARLPSISQVRTQLPPSNWEAELRRIPILSFVLYPQVFLLFCLLSQMAAMNFDMPLISGLAIRGRWISLAFFALIGFIGWFSVSDRTTPKLMVIFEYSWLSAVSRQFTRSILNTPFNASVHSSFYSSPSWSEYGPQVDRPST